MQTGKSSERGALLIEILLALLVLALAAAGSVSSTISGMSLEQDNRETAVATDTLRHVVEELETIPLDEVFARFNADPADDPDGAGTAPGNLFAVDPHRTSGLLTSGVLSPASAPTHRQTMNVEFTFPLDMDGHLSEMVSGGMWGQQGWDLDGDGTLAAGDRSTTYVILPVHVRVTWVSPRGVSAVQLVRVLAHRGE